jgi:phosphohistidine swiveling domain-containing protein
MAAWMGVGRGRVKVIRISENPMAEEIAEIEEQVQAGDILVTNKTVPQLEPVMKTAAAVITEVGGLGSHAAVVAREFEKPTLVGVEGAIAALLPYDGEEVTADISRGVIYRGRLAVKTVKVSEVENLQSTDKRIDDRLKVLEKSIGGAVAPGKFMRLANDMAFLQVSLDRDAFRKSEELLGRFRRVEATEESGRSPEVIFGSRPSGWIQSGRMISWVEEGYQGIETEDQIRHAVGESAMISPMTLKEIFIHVAGSAN